MQHINIQEVQELITGKPAQSKELIAKHIYTAEELFNLKIKEIPFLWQNLVAQTGLCCLTGSSDCNKSTLLRQLALEIALESEEFLGFKLNAKHNKVIYVSTEDDANSIGALIGKQFVEGLPVKALGNIRFLFSTANLIKELHDMLAEQLVDLVIIDTWTDTFQGDINQSNRVRMNFEQFKNLSMKFGCAFIFVHHQGKASEGNAPSKNNLLGSQGIEAKMRTVIELRRDKTASNRRLMTVVKGNYTNDNLKGKPFVLELNEQVMLFGRRADVDSSLLSLDFNPVNKKYNKDEILKVAIPLRSKGVSFEKTLVQLEEQFGKEVPSLTTLKNWFTEQSVSQPPSK
ncbi:AAA family ATPase [Chitinophaga sp. Mgbs1]|uniref:AAA family ATPase n=1 Tax=Chitinophaga solisilvae TaxID=1233460 RepID=A0A433W9C2_9BACT|nr:AAA family ATPase [Chitinophaga solisilvae]